MHGSLVAWVLVALLLTGVGCHPAASGVPAARPDPIPAVLLDSTLQRIQAEHETPALAAAVVRSEGLVAAGAAGTRYRGTSAPVSVGDRFHVGSNAKAMTATLLALLVEEGKLRWTSTVAEVFPELSDSIHPHFLGATVEHFLSHRGGVPAFTSPVEFEELAALEGSPMEQRAVVTSRLLRRAPITPPGEAFLYSNAGYTVVGSIAERVTGEAWEDLLQARLFQPLGITTAGYGWPAEADTTQPRGHLTLPLGPAMPQPLDHPYRLPTFLAPAGDVYLSVEDYAGFLSANLQGLRGQHPLLSPETWRRLHTPVGEYAFGWAVTSHHARGVQSLHAGSAGTFFVQAVLLQDHDIGVFVVANAADTRTQQGISETVRLLFGRYGPQAANPRP